MRLRRTALAAALVLASGLAGSATAGPAGLPAGAGGRATSNVHFLYNQPYGTGTGGTFLGTTYFATAAATEWFGGPVYTQAVTGGLFAFDASSPEKPLLVGALPIPHHENEDLQVSAKRKLAIISQQPYRANPEDNTSAYLPGREFLVDVSIPSAMRLVSTIDLPATVGKVAATGKTLGGPGHTTTLVGNDSYLWVSGARNGAVYVVDIRDAAHPKNLGYIASPAGAAYGVFTPGVVHDVDVDQFGDVWLTGSGGTAMYSLTRNPLKPALMAAVSPKDNAKAQQFIHHGSQRLDRNTVLVTEEDYETNCNAADHQDGSLQSWRIDRAHKRLVEIGSWDAPTGGDASDSPVAKLGSLCSSHWFTINGAKVVADAWYSAGVRFLDVSNPAKPRPIGMWAGDGTIASQARFVPGRPDLVYVADYMRGLDVIKIDRAGRGARTTTPSDEKAVSGLTPLGKAKRPTISFHAHEDFGWVCAVPTRLT